MPTLSWFVSYARRGIYRNSNFFSNHAKRINRSLTMWKITYVIIFHYNVMRCH